MYVSCFIILSLCMYRYTRNTMFSCTVFRSWILHVHSLIHVQCVKFFVFMSVFYEYSRAQTNGYRGIDKYVKSMKKAFEDKNPVYGRNIASNISPAIYRQAIYRQLIMSPVNNIANQNIASQYIADE